MRSYLGILGLTALAGTLLLSGCASTPDTVPAQFMSLAADGELEQAGELLVEPDDYYAMVVHTIVERGCHFGDPVASKTGTSEMTDYTSVCDQDGGEQYGTTRLSFLIDESDKIAAIVQNGGEEF